MHSNSINPSTRHHDLTVKASANDKASANVASMFWHLRTRLDRSL